MANAIVVKPVAKNTFDVFFGEKGWDEFIRVHRNFDRNTKKVFFSVVKTGTGATSVSREMWETIKRSI